MKPSWASLLSTVAVVSLTIVGCSQSSPAPSAAKAPAPSSESSKQATSVPAPTMVAGPTSTSGSPTTKRVEFPAPGKSITMISPWPAGGGSDLTARIASAGAEKALGASIQIVNKPGAASQVGVTELANAKPDGYTVGLTNLPSSVIPYLDPEREAAYGRKDLSPVAAVVFDPEAIAVKADSPYKTLRDLVDAAKSNPESITVATSGVMGDNHLGLLLFQKEANVKFRHVAMEGGAAAMTAVLGNHVDAICLTAGGMPAQYKSGEIRIVGIMDKAESPFYPGVKTMEDSGYKVSYGSTRGFSVPSGTPKEIVDILSAAFKRAMQDDEVKKKMEEQALMPRYMDAVQFSAYWDEFETQTKPLIEVAKQQVAGSKQYRVVREVPPTFGDSGSRSN